MRIVVAGSLECSRFAHADYIAICLSERHETFEYKRIALSQADWEMWITETCQARGWSHHRSPVAWTEPAMWGGRGYLIGGASDFFEYCYNHYGARTAMADEDICKWKQNLKEMYRTQESRRHRQHIRPGRVAISGAASTMCPQLIAELLRLPQLRTRHGLLISLHDDRGSREQLVTLVDDISGMQGGEMLFEIRIVHELEEALKKCDLLIILNECPKLHGESLYSWLRRNVQLMTDISRDVQKKLPADCRIVLAAPGDSPLCFNANVLVEYATNIIPDNIVAVTADLGLEFVPALEQLAGNETDYIESPPVWGSVGINRWVDLNNAILHAKTFCPNKRGLKSVEGSTLPQGTYLDVVRTMRDVVANVPGMWLEVQDKKRNVERLLQRPMHAAKVRATIDLLRSWFGEHGEKQLPETSLGILSNGAFGIPKGMYFSQPVILKNGVWRPNENMPTPVELSVKLSDLFPFPTMCLKNFAIGKRFNTLWLMSTKELKYYNKILEEKRLDDERQIRDEIIGEIIYELRDRVMTALSEHKHLEHVAFSGVQEALEAEPEDDEKLDTDEQVDTEDEEDDTMDQDEDEDDED